MNIEQNKTIESLSLTELKSLAYDAIAAKEQAERTLALVNKTIASKIEAEKKLSELTLKEAKED